MSGTRHETQPVATIIYDNGSELTGTAVTTSDGSVGIRIPNEFFKTGLLPDGSMPEGVKSVSIRPKHPKGVLPLTDDMVYMAVTASLRDAVGLPLNEAAGGTRSRSGWIPCPCANRCDCIGSTWTVMARGT